MTTPGWPFEILLSSVINDISIVLFRQTLFFSLVTVK